MITVDFVVQLQRELVQARGLSVECSDLGPLEAALSRVENRIQYGIVSHPVEIAAWYAAAVSRGHCFADANKRTGMLVMLTYLEKQGITFPFEHSETLEDKIVDLADGNLSADEFAEWLESVCNP